MSFQYPNKRSVKKQPSTTTKLVSGGHQAAFYIAMANVKMTRTNLWYILIVSRPPIAHWLFVSSVLAVNLCSWILCVSLTERNNTSLSFESHFTKQQATVICQTNFTYKIITWTEMMQLTTETRKSDSANLIPSS